MNHLDQAVALIDKQIAELKEIRTRLMMASAEISRTKYPVDTPSNRSSAAQRRRWAIKDNEIVGGA